MKRAIGSTNRQPKVLSRFRDYRIRNKGVKNLKPVEARPQPTEEDREQ